MNWIDTPLLVYEAVVGHPAREAVERELGQGAWGGTVLALPEVYQVLTRDYAVAPREAAEAVDRLVRSPIHWESVDATQVSAAIGLRMEFGLQSTDAVLLLLADADRGTLVTQDQRLLRTAQDRGIAVRNPITPDLSTAVASWEKQRLPPKGVARILSAVERWLRDQDPGVADRFLETTALLTRLPT